MTTIQAPCANFVAAMVTMTTAVVAAPSPLTHMRYATGARVRSQRTTIPLCESVNDTKTPIRTAG